MESLISIIIPTYNRAHLILETLRSISLQTYQNWECIVVDDGSNDNTAEIVGDFVRNDQRFSYVSRPESLPKGPNACRNYGFELSKGMYVKWFDSDDILQNDAFEAIVMAFEKDTDVNISSLSYVDSELNAIQKVHRYKSDSTIPDYLTGKISYFTFLPTWTRSFLLKQQILFDENITNLDDWDFNLRMLYENPKLTYIHETLIKYRLHPNSLSKEISKLNIKEIRSEFRARKKHLKILKRLNKEYYHILLNFTIMRYKYLLREAMIKNNPVKHKIFADYTRLLFSSFKIVTLFKTLIVFVIFIFFKKGYTLLSR